MRVFVDTGGWIAIVAGADRYHQAAAECYESLLHQKSQFITSDYVIDEAVTRVRYDLGHKVAIRLLDLLAEAEEGEALQVSRVDEPIWEAAEEVFRKYDDQEFSFTDCTSFVLARTVEVDVVFGFDRHFAIHGFRVVPSI